MEYAKPHLPYDGQVARLRDRGLEITDASQTLRVLKHVGYYRLSAYTYVLRAKGDATAVSSEERPPRSENFVDGATFDDALALYRFDEKLRACLVTGLQQLEVSLRVQIGYQLGKTHRFGHLDPQHLDHARCSAESRTPAPGSSGMLDEHSAWLAKYTALQSSAKTEEYVKHFILNYDGKCPIWVATEFMTFGNLTQLYWILNARDSKKIATNLGAGNRDVLHGWLKALNVLRNHCAHNARIWNRGTVYPPTRPPVALVHERLHHVQKADNHRLYLLAAILGHLLIQTNPKTDWPRQLVSVIKKFPQVHGMTPQNTMGFTDAWETNDLWKHNPDT